MNRRLPALALRATIPATRSPLTGLEKAIRTTRPGSTILAIETESPMSVAEELNIQPPLSGKTAAFMSAMQATVKAWEAMSLEERLVVGYVRYFFHPSGAVQVQPISDPRKCKRALKV